MRLKNVVKFFLLLILIDANFANGMQDHKTIQRCSSVNELNILALNKNQANSKMSIEEYLETAKKFINANNLQGNWEDIKNNLEVPQDKLNKLTDCFGKEKYQDNIDVVLKEIEEAEDISPDAWDRLYKLSIEQLNLLNNKASLFATVSGAELMQNPEHELNSIRAGIKQISDFQSLLKKAKQAREALDSGTYFTVPKKDIDQLVNLICNSEDHSPFCPVKSDNPLRNDQLRFNLRTRLAVFLKNPKNFQTVVKKYFERIGGCYYDAFLIRNANIVTIDISFPNLMRFATKFADSHSSYSHQERVQRRELEQSIEDVLALYRKYKVQIDSVTSNRKNGLSNQSGLSEEEIDELIEQLCGKNWIEDEGLQKLFTLHCIDAPKEKSKILFKNTLKQVLRNTTGFQLIMSLLTASSIISNKDNPFDNNNSLFILIRMLAGQGSRFIKKVYAGSNGRDWYDDKYAKINLDELQEITLHQSLSSILTHELAHAYHYMIGAAFHSSFVTFSILNNPVINSVDRFFPMLSHKAMTEILPLIKTDDVTEDVIKDIVIDVIKYGFWNVLVSDINFSSSDDLLLANLIKNNEFVQKCIYLKATVLPNKSGRNDYLWSDNEEMLTLQGYIPIWIGDKLYIIEDRQNEHIFRVRDGESEEGSYRFHDCSALANVFENLKSKVDSKDCTKLFRLLKANLVPQLPLHIN